jgi:radical SAM protein with 4Fe4S-binding SPASM domain
VFRLGEAIRVDGIVVFYGYFQNETSAARHEAVMQEKLGTTPWSWKGYLLGYDTLDTTALVETVRRVHGRTWSFPYVFAPDLAYEDIPRYYREPAETFGYRTCIVPWSMIEIMPNGDVVTCRDYPDYVVGNIKDDTLLDLWNNERYQRFRAVLKSERLLPVCSRCCGLMDW